MKTSPAAVLRVQDGVYTVKEDNGCKQLRNANEINAVSLPEYTCICVRRVVVLVLSGTERFKSLPLGTKSIQLMSRKFRLKLYKYLFFI